MLGLLSSWVVDQHLPLEPDELVPELLVIALCAVVVLHQSTSYCGANCIDLSHLTAALDVDGDIDPVYSVHGLCDPDWLQCLSTSQLWFHDVDWLAVYPDPPLACLDGGSGNRCLALAACVHYLGGLLPSQFTRPPISMRLLPGGS